MLQVCRVDLQLQKFAQDNVELVPDTIELLTDTELTQYYIQAWSLDYNDPGIHSCEEGIISIISIYVVYIEQVYHLLV